MNIRSIALITFLFIIYNCQASIGMHQLMRGDMPVVVNPPQLTIRQQLEFHQENMRANAKKTEFSSKYPEFLITSETYKNLSKPEKKDFQIDLNRSMQNELINRTCNCMDKNPSNTAEKCFDAQSFKCSKNLEELLDIEYVDEELRNLYLISFELAQQEIAKIIFNPENN